MGASRMMPHILLPKRLNLTGRASYYRHGHSIAVELWAAMQTAEMTRIADFGTGKFVRGRFIRKRGAPCALSSPKCLVYRSTTCSG